MANIKRANTSGITKSGVAIPDVPDAPTIGAATNVGTSRAFNNGSATVAFTANPRGGTSTSFTATSTPGSFTASGAGSPLTVTGLQSATSYTFAVTGTNASATGAASAASSSITATTVPQAPTIGTATLASGQSYTGSASISVPFTANATGGSSITGYTVTSSSGATGSGSSSPISVSETVGNPTSTARTYTVTASNGNGASTASSSSNSIAAVSVPQAPTIGAVTAGDSSVTVAYTAGATGGAAVSTFTATSSPGGFTGTGASPITVSGLTNGTAYTFTVTATNSAGTSAASSASSSVTPVNPTSWTQIATQTYGGGSAVYLQFTGIPTSYKHLYVTWNDRHTTAGDNGLGPIVLLNGGGDQYSLVNFATYYLNGINGEFNATNWTFGYYYFFNVNVSGGVESTATQPRASHSMLIPHYTSNNFNRVGNIRGGHSMRNTSGGNQFVGNGFNSLGATTTTTEIYLGMYSGGPNPTNPFAAGSTFTVWGIE
jgi:hypothetical protein